MLKLASLSTWRGSPVWKCRLCPKTETSRDRMMAHLTGRGSRDHNVQTGFDVPATPADQAADDALEAGEDAGAAALAANPNLTGASDVTDAGGTTIAKAKTIEGGAS